jgi:Rrf2 family transcriptional regulator, nitric oxide-sensitive transcriptional repressor
MQLTRFSDYALRALLYLGAQPDKVVSASTISASYGISTHHLVKVTKWLTQRGLVRAQRGKSGGVALAVSPGEIFVGPLLRETEPTVDLLDCFDEATAPCPITPVCRLRTALIGAREAFFRELDELSLADLLGNATDLLQILTPPTPQEGDLEPKTEPEVS